MLSAPGKWKQKNCRKFEANLGCAQQDVALSPAPQKQRERKKEEKKRRREGRREEGKKSAGEFAQQLRVLDFCSVKRQKAERPDPDFQ